MKYRKKPVVIDAVQWRGRNLGDVVALSDDRIIRKCGKVLIIRTLEGDMTAGIGDYIIRGVKGEVYPCKEDIFEQTYEEVDGH